MGVIMRQEIIQKMKETADYIFRHPELSLKEYQSSRALAAFLADEGFKISWGLRVLRLHLLRSGAAARTGTGRLIL